MPIGVYVIHCITNNSHYVGETINSQERLRQHVKRLKAGAHENKRLQNAWSKFGHHAFVFKMVWTCPYEVEITLTRDNLSKLTRRMESTIGSAMIEHGYDLMNAKPFEHWTDANPMTNPDVRSLGSAAALRRWADAETRAKLVEGIRSAMRRPEVVEKRKAAQRLRAATPQDRQTRSAQAKKIWADSSKRENIMKGLATVHKRQSKPVRCVETGAVFESAAAASRSLGKRITAISTAIWASKRCGGFTWEFVGVTPPTK